MLGPIRYIGFGGGDLRYYHPVSSRGDFDAALFLRDGDLTAPIRYEGGIRALYVRVPSTKIQFSVDGIESASEVSSPALGQEHGLTADDVESSSEVSGPVLAETETGLTADDVESTSEVSSPSLGQAHALLADNVEAASEVSTPNMNRATDGFPIMQYVGFGGGDIRNYYPASGPRAFTVVSVESASEVSSPALGQEHGLTADDVESASEVSSPAIGSADHQLFADDVTALSEVSIPDFGQAHAFTADEPASQSSVSSPALDDGTPQPVARKGRRKRKRYSVTIDGETFTVPDLQAVVDLLDQARDVAEEQAERSVERNVAPKRPKIEVRTASGQKTQSRRVQRAIQRTESFAERVYREARERVARQRDTDREISLLMRRKLQEERDRDDEEAIIALLM